MCRTIIRDMDYVHIVLTQKFSILWLKMDYEGVKPQISELIPTTNFPLKSNSYSFFILGSTKIDEKLYNNPF